MTPTGTRESPNTFSRSIGNEISDLFSAGLSMIIVNFKQESDLGERGTDLALLEIMESIINTCKAVGHKFDWAWFECTVCQSRCEDLHCSRRKLVLFHIERKLSRRFDILHVSCTSVSAMPHMMV